MKNKRGQFYLIAAVIIIAMILGFFAIANKSKTQSITEIYEAAEELEIEGRAVLDNAIYNNLDDTQTKEQFENFTKLYSNYTTIENLYFIFGNTDGIVVAAYRRLAAASIYIDAGEGNSELQVPVRVYTKAEYNPTADNVNITVGEAIHGFELKEGENFYYITSQGSEEGAEYIFTGNIIEGRLEE